MCPSGLRPVRVDEVSVFWLDGVCKGGPLRLSKSGGALDGGDDTLLGFDTVLVFKKF